MNKRMTISDAYRAQQQELHKNPKYGVASLGFAPIIKQLMERNNIKEISDYGAGKCNLRKGLGDLGKTDFAYFPYDPAFPEYGAPAPADLVACIDVLEHIEEPFLDSVLDELKSLVRKIGFFSIHCGPAVKVLSDGRNAHLIQQPAAWWLPRLSRFFEVAHLQRSQGGFWVIVEPSVTGRTLNGGRP